MSGGRILAQMVRHDGAVRRLAVVERRAGEVPQVYQPGGEIHSTEFFNGLILWLPEGIEAPAGVRAADAAALAKELPEPQPGQPAVMAMIPFV